mmetsp:Transcript_286/g.2320  ORF Transcript_286/g.2320 Transcript_286/m.2320 type:complete len:85 (+) Transcript_286:1103-1357(+)
MHDGCVGVRMSVGGMNGQKENQDQASNPPSAYKTMRSQAHVTESMDAEKSTSSCIVLLVLLMLQFCCSDSQTHAQSALVRNLRR